MRLPSRAAAAPPPQSPGDRTIAGIPPGEVSKAGDGNTPYLDPSSAGILLAVSLFLGAGIGTWQHQPSAGLLIGLVVGLAIILGQWLLERRR